MQNNIMHINDFGTKIYKNENGKLHRTDGPAVEDANGDKLWYINGELHREDGPAIENSNGDKFWYINNKLHREDGPAIERINGPKEWWINGKRHRDNGPAIEYVDGTKAWFIDGKRHRIDGPAMEYAGGSKYWFIEGNEYTEEEYNKKINLVPDNTMKIDADGTKKYYNKEGQRHREDGPAIEYADGSKTWFVNGLLHREDGPAREWANGSKEWYINGKEYTEEGFKNASEKINVEVKMKKNVAMMLLTCNHIKLSGSVYNIMYRNGMFVIQADGGKDIYQSENITKVYEQLDALFTENNLAFKERKRRLTTVTKLGVSEIYSVTSAQKTPFNIKWNKDLEYTSPKYKTKFSSIDELRKHIVNNEDIFKLFNVSQENIKDFLETGEMVISGNLLDKSGIAFASAEKSPTEDNQQKDISSIKTITIGSATGAAPSLTPNSFPSPTSTFVPGTGSSSLKLDLNSEDLLKIQKIIDVLHKEDNFFKVQSLPNIPVGNYNEYYSEPFEFSVGEKEDNLVKEDNTVKEDSNIDKSLMSKIKSDPTFIVATTAMDSAAKLAVARQASRILSKFIQSIATALLTKLGYEAYIPILDSDLGKAMLEMSSPFILHAAVTHGLIPFEKYNEYIETATRWSIDANTAHYTMKYSDQAMDMFQSFMTDPKMRENFGDILKLGVAMSKAEAGNSGMLEKLVMPNSFADFDALIKEAEVEKVR